MSVHVCHPGHMEVTGHFTGVSSLLLPYRFWSSKCGQQTWPQAPSPTESFHQPDIFMQVYNGFSFISLRKFHLVLAGPQKLALNS